MAVYDPSSQLIWGVGVVKRKGHTSGLTSLGLHSPKPGNLILDACITGPKVALHICAGTHIQDRMTGSVPGQMLLLLAVSKEKAGHPGRQSQSVLLLSTHHTASLYSPYRERRAENPHGQSEFFTAILNVGWHSKRLEHSSGPSEYSEAS